MRVIQHSQLTLGEADPSRVAFDLRSRDDVTKVLLGLQEVYRDDDCREKVFDELRALIPEYKDGKTGRQGMDLWNVLVLGAIRLGCGVDYDRLKDYADHHVKVRQMMGHSRLDENTYALQTIKDNAGLLDEQALERISRIVVEAGHRRLGVEEEELQGRCDSFVVETDVHYPTDINLLFDAMCKSILLVAEIAAGIGLGGWRKAVYNVAKVRRAFRKAERLKRSKPRSEKGKQQKERAVRKAHEAYVELCEELVWRIVETTRQARENGHDRDALAQMDWYVACAIHQIDLVRRRVLNGETIPHNEKIFSIFEEHTEWITKGKAGVPQELGVKVCILTDQYRFILHHRVMENEEDVDVAVPMIEATQAAFERLTGCSFDKGFHSPANQASLQELLDEVVLPKKGKLNAAERQREHSEWFVQGRTRHSAVESSINGLEHTGLDRCPDRGRPHFKRYVAWAMLARNLHTLGALVRQDALDRQAKAA